MESTHHSQTVHPTHVPLFNTGTLVFSDVTRPKWLFRQKCVKAEGRRDRDSGKKGTRGEARGQRPKTNEIRRERVSGKKKKKKRDKGGGSGSTAKRGPCTCQSFYFSYFFLFFFLFFFWIYLFILFYYYFFLLASFASGKYPSARKAATPLYTMSVEVAALNFE